MAVLLGSRDPERGRQAAARLVDEGLAVEPLQVEVTDESGMAIAADQVSSAYGRLDLLVNSTWPTPCYAQMAQSGPW
jgi:NAD(P)-dependent dehydrogenase (short-subunit alcohol dehydrogenase family)